MKGIRKSPLKEKQDLYFKRFLCFIICFLLLFFIILHNFLYFDGYHKIPKSQSLYYVYGKSSENGSKITIVSGLSFYLEDPPELKDGQKVVLVVNNLKTKDKKDDVVIGIEEVK